MLVKLWSNKYFVNPEFTIEALAVIKRANYLVTNFNMTDS